MLLCRFCAKNSPLHASLIKITGKEPAWNFTKYLIDKNGNVVGPEPTVAQDCTDLIVISHGWNNNRAEAEALYRTLFTHFAALHPGVLRGERLPTPPLGRAVRATEQAGEAAADDEDVTETAGVLQVADMSRMEEIKHTIGEYDGSWPYT